MSNAVVPFESSDKPKAIVPGTYEAVMSMAQMISQSGLAPGGMDRPEKVAIALFYGLEIGLTPMSAIQTIAVVNGRPALWGDAAIALVRSSGLCEYVSERIEGEGDARVAICETKRKGDPRPTERRFSVDDAKLAGLWQTQARVTRSGRNGDYEKDNDSPWYRYPARMLQMRARAFCLRDAFADVLRGIAIAEEQQDVQSMRDVTPVEDAPIPPTSGTSAAPKPPAREVQGEITEPKRDAPKSDQQKPVEQRGDQQGGDAPNPPSDEQAGGKPFAAYLAEFEADCAAAVDTEALRALWTNRDRESYGTQEELDQLVAVRDKHKARLSQPAQDGASAPDESKGATTFSEPEFRENFLKRLAAAKTGDEALNLNDEACALRDNNTIPMDVFIEFYETPLADAIERLP